MSVCLFDMGALGAGCSMLNCSYYMYCYWALEMIMGTIKCYFPSIYLHVSWIRASFKRWTFNLIFIVFPGVCFVNLVFPQPARNFSPQPVTHQVLPSESLAFPTDGLEKPIDQISRLTDRDKSSIFLYGYNFWNLTRFIKQAKREAIFRIEAFNMVRFFPFAQTPQQSKIQMSSSFSSWFVDLGPLITWNRNMTCMICLHRPRFSLFLN